MDKRKNNGGHSTKGVAGRKSKSDEEKAKELLKKALKMIYRKDEDEENIVKFLVSYIQDTTKGKDFAAEHLLGKPKEKIEQDINNIGEVPIIQIIRPKEDDN